MFSRRSLLVVPLSVAMAAGAVASAAAQTYPDRPIKMIVPYPAAGPIDTMARLLGQQLSQRFGQQVVIDNHPGAGSMLGTKAAAGAEPDGYTLLFGSSGSLAVAPALYANYDLDILKAFVPVGAVALLPHVLVVNPSVPARTVGELIAYAKANPGKLNFGASIGTPPHLLSTLFGTKAGIDVVYVPYKGSAASVTDLLSGETQFTIDGLTGLYPLIQAGKVRALALARAERWPQLPDVPTLVESGFADFTVDAWTGVAAPAGTPTAIVGVLNRAINEGLATAEAKAGLARFSAIAQTGSPQDFGKFVAAELPKWAAIVKLSGARIEQ
ncbi:MAG TPA: tripartite tricarboxylate transporter substrate binding protein [Xanthobacteraceae bacterium]